MDVSNTIATEERPVENRENDSNVSITKTSSENSDSNQCNNGGVLRKLIFSTKYLIEEDMNAHVYLGSTLSDVTVRAIGNYLYVRSFRKPDPTYGSNSSEQNLPLTSTATIPAKIHSQWKIVNNNNNNDSESQCNQSDEVVITTTNTTDLLDRLPKVVRELYECNYA